jgi:hypothetical protein
MSQLTEEAIKVLPVNRLKNKRNLSMLNIVHVLGTMIEFT